MVGVGWGEGLGSTTLSSPPPEAPQRDWPDTLVIFTTHGMKTDENKTSFFHHLSKGELVVFPEWLKHALSSRCPRQPSRVFLPFAERQKTNARNTESPNETCHNRLFISYLERARQPPRADSRVGNESPLSGAVKACDNCLHESGHQTSDKTAYLSLIITQNVSLDYINLQCTASNGQVNQRM